MLTYVSYEEEKTNEEDMYEMTTWEYFKRRMRNHFEMFACFYAVGVVVFIAGYLIGSC